MKVDSVEDNDILKPNDENLNTKIVEAEKMIKEKQSSYEARMIEYENRMKYFEDKRKVF